MKDERYEDRTPHPSREQGSSEPERPVPQHEREEQSGQPSKPSQAEGERETMEEKGL
jgi:hypothetical protein